MQFDQRMVHAGAARGSTFRRRGESIIRVGASFLGACVSVRGQGQEEGEGDVAVEEDGGAPNRNSDIAKAVEVRTDEPR